MERSKSFTTSGWPACISSGVEWTTLTTCWNSRSAKKRQWRILDTVKQSLSSVPFGFLQKAGPENLLTFVIEEHPQTIALILSHLPSALSAQVLSKLPSNKQLEVVSRVATMEQTSPEVVQDVERSLEIRMKSTFMQQLEKAGGVSAVAQMLNVTDRMTNKAILESLEQESPELVDQIRRLMFVFDDLMKLDDKVDSIAAQRGRKLAVGAGP